MVNSHKQLNSILFYFALFAGAVYVIPAHSQIKVACVGNSITSNGGYVNFLNDNLPNAYEVRNSGVSGRTLLKNGDNPIWAEQKFADIFTWKPDVITIMLGTNDSKPWNWDDHGEEFVSDLQTMIDTFMTIDPAPQIIPVLPPHAGEESFGIRGSIIYNEIIPVIKLVAEANNLDVIDINTPTRDKFNLMPDEVHPNAEGHILMGNIFLEGILNFVEDRTPPRKLLWYGDAPQAQGSEPADKPDLQIYLADPANNTGAAVLICPGGGYGNLAMGHEGTDVAEWLNSIGIAGIILKYRHSPYRHPVPLEDVRRGMKIIRHYAGEWGIDDTKIGVLGFSAGGHLASSLGVHYEAGVTDSLDFIERQSSRPDFMALIYPVITLEGPYAHTGSRNNLLGPNPDQSLIDEMSTYKQVDANTPPAFLATGDADVAVPMENSVMMDSSLKAAGVSSTLFIEPGKDHGYGLDGDWPDEFEKWLGDIGILTVGVDKRYVSANRPLIGGRVVKDKGALRVLFNSQGNPNLMFNGLGQKRPVIERD